MIFLLPLAAAIQPHGGHRSSSSTNVFRSPDAKEKAVSSTIFQAICLLEQHRIHFTLDRTRPDTVRINATLVGERLEIDVFEDNHVEISRFFGSEDNAGGMSLLEQILTAESKQRLAQI